MELKAEAFRPGVARVPYAGRVRSRSRYRKYMVGGTGTLLSGLATMAAHQALKWYSKPRRTRTVVKSGYPRRVTRKSFPKKVKSQIRELKRLTESDMGTLIYRHIGATTVKCSVASSVHSGLTGLSLTNVEVPLAQLRYYNPSTPTSLTTASGLSGTYQKEFLYQRMYTRWTARNNYQVPCKLTMYIVAPKDATSISPVTAFTNGLTDIGAPSSTSVLIYLTDSPQFNDLWRIVKSKSVELAPGRSCTLSHSVKPFQYDPSTFDSHNLTYNKGFHAYTCVFRVEGILGHDTVANEETSLAAGVDVEEMRTFEIKYSAGADIKTIVLNDDRSSSFTNAGVVSSKPVADNIQYSVA